MSSTFGNLKFVQNSYTNNWQRGYPGQLVAVSASFTTIITSVAATGDIPMGRGVVTAVSQFQEPATSLPWVSKEPFSIALPDASTVAADLAGITYRPLIPAANVDNGSGTPVAGDCATYFGAMVDFASRLQIYVNMPVGVAVAYNDPVYITIQTPNADNMELGEFTNTADGANNILVPNAVWWINKTASADDNIGVIKLL